jgi:site-specific DNA-adenine methylase
VSYPGAKGQAGVWQRIIGQMPPHSVYVEPFFGSGQVFWRKLRAENNLVIDADVRCLAKVNREDGVKAIVGDALKILPDMAAWLPTDTVCYIDPPYMLLTRQSRLYYEHEPEVADPHWHCKLLAIVQTFKFRVLLSSYPSDLYSSSLQGWRCCSYATMTRGGKRTECLWCNFPEPEELHDWRFAGLNFRQRFGLKRFVRRWLDRIEAMPARRRGYVLHELADGIWQRQGRRGGPHDQTRPFLASVATSPSATGGAPGRK